MRQVIDGRLYDTETAEEVTECGSVTPYRTDFEFWEGTLYRTAGGASFVAGEGGARSLFARSAGGGTVTGGSGIVPLSPEEAAAIAERALSADEYARWFPVVTA